MKMRLQQQVSPSELLGFLHNVIFEGFYTIRLLLNCTHASGSLLGFNLALLRFTCSLVCPGSVLSGGNYPGNIGYFH